MAKILMYIPENLEEFIERDPGNFFVIKDIKHVKGVTITTEKNIFVKEHLIYIISVYCKLKVKTGSRPVPVGSREYEIYADELQDVVARYKLYLEYLLKHKIISRDDTYRKKTDKAKGAPIETALMPEYQNQYVTGYPVTHHTLYQNLVNKFKPTKKEEEKAERQRITIMKNKALHNWFDMDNIKVDIEGAKKYLRENDLPENHAGKKWDKNTHLKILYRIKFGDYYFHRDDTTRRLNTNFTSLWSKLRQFVTYNDEVMVMVDISNCQPYEILRLLDEPFYSKDKEDKKGGDLITVGRIFIPLKPLKSNKKRKKKLTVFELIKKITDKNLDNLEHYKELVLAGGFYEFIGEKLIKKFPNAYFKAATPEGYDRGEIKELFLKIIHKKREKTKAGRDKRNLYERHLRKFFPSIFKILDVVNDKRHNQLAQILMRMESRIVIDKITKRITKEKPEMPMFTIHDCLICPEEYQYYVTHIMVDELKKAIGHRTAIKIEPFSGKKPLNPDGITQDIQYVMTKDALLELTGDDLRLKGDGGNTNKLLKKLESVGISES